MHCMHFDAVEFDKMLQNSKCVNTAKVCQWPYEKQIKLTLSAPGANLRFGLDFSFRQQKLSICKKKTPRRKYLSRRFRTVIRFQLQTYY